MSGVVQPGLVSTIVPVYNRAALLAEAVQSVLDQTYRPIEIVIVDDGSTDETTAVGRELAAAHPAVVRYVRKCHEGFTRAVNAGLPLVTGEYVQFLDSDDLLMPDKFRIQVEGLRAHPGCGISYAMVREYDIDGPWSGQPSRRTGDTFAELFPHILAGRLWPSPAPLYRREVIAACGLYPDVGIHPEWEYECRAAATGVKLHHAAVFLADVRGTHRREGRQKGGVPDARLREYVQVLEGVHRHARDAGVPASAFGPLSQRLFTAAQRCARAGLIEEAQRCLALARQPAGAPARWQMAAYAAASTHLGWERAGTWWQRIEMSVAGRLASGLRRAPGRGLHVLRRAPHYAWRRGRELYPWLRGKEVLRRYSAHYRRARRAYGEAVGRPGPLAVSPRTLGVRVVATRTPDALLALPADFDAAVARVARSAADALSRPEHCRFFPALSDPPAGGCTMALPQVARGEVITIQLREPWDLDGLHDLCAPLLEQLERQLYRSYVIADKVYVYRSPVSRQVPRASWLWHFDNHPREMLKVMVYLTDVSAGTAPFEYLCDGATGRPLYGSPLAPFHGLARVPAGEIDRRLARGWSRATVTGPRGTLVVFDDNVVHRATLARTGHRDVIVFQVRPVTFRARPHIDARWTGSFDHQSINADPWDLTPYPRA